jgi:EF hand
MKAKRRVISNFEACSVAVITAFALTSAPLAGAQTPAPANTAPAAMAPKPVSTAEMDSAFARADKNKDGKLSKEESDMLPSLAQKFDQADADGDRFLSRAEYEKAVKSY